jgi:hypothetical protein
MSRTAGDIVVDRILHWFGRGLPQQVNPWWWPMNDGASLADWGLSTDLLKLHRLSDSTVLNSVRGVAAKNKPRLSGFLGSVGSTRETCDVVLLSTRPSQDSFPGTGPIKLVYRLAQAGLTHRTHTTNLIKFRGHEDDELMTIQGVAPAIEKRMLRASVDCFAAEIRALEPKCLLIAGGGTRKTLEIMSDSAFPSAHVIREILATAPQAHVRSWVSAVDADDLSAEWAEAAERLLR